MVVSAVLAQSSQKDKRDTSGRPNGKGMIAIPASAAPEAVALQSVKLLSAHPN
jgi:hypothetical protein